MSEAPFLTRLRARVAGEVPAGVLDAYRAAGADTYDLFVSAERRRSAGGGVVGVFFVCTWNAFVLQTLGDAFVEADYEADPSTVGFVPPVTAEQALAFYEQVEHWLVRARQAERDSQFELDVHVPAELPPWVAVEPCPEPHLHAMLTAGNKVVEHAQIALNDLERSGSADAPLLERLRGELTAATTTADYARQLHTQFHQGRGGQELHERIERSIKEAIERAFELGQLAAMPELAGRSRDAATTRPGRLPRPGERGFDPWCLTDPDARDRWQQDPQARRAIDTLWRLDPGPDRTLEIQAEIDAALEAGAIAYATDRSGRRLGNYYCCPWGAIYEAKRPVRIAGKRLRALQQFTFDVSAEEIAEGAPFKRDLLLGSFQPTNEIDYCDPTAG